MGAQGIESQDLPKRVKRVPKGTSAYQAAWIFDEDDEDDDDADDDIEGSDGESGNDMMDAGAIDSGMINGCATCSPFPRHGPCGT